MTKELMCDCGAEERRNRGYHAKCYSFCASQAPQQKYTPISVEESNQRLAVAMGIKGDSPSSKTVAEIVRHTDLLLESGDEVAHLTPDEWRRIKEAIGTVETTDWRSIARARGEVLDKLSDQIAALKKTELTPEEPSRCTDCGVMLVPQARHFSGCKSHPGEPAVKAK